MSQAGPLNNDGSSNPEIPTRFDADISFAIPAAHILNVLGDVAPQGTTPHYTVGNGGGNTLTSYVQIASAVAATDATRIGLAAFNSAQFTVDANGFVSLTGGGSVAFDQIAVDASTAPGTNPVLPTLAGQFTVTGAQVAAGIVGANVIRTDSLAASTYTIEIQRTAAVGASASLNNGVSHFDSAAFDVDANGFVQLNGGGIAATSFDVQANTGPGTDPVVPTAAGVVTVNGAVVANHSVVLESRSRAANAYNLEVQYGTSAAATDGTKSGVAHFNSTQFTVDAVGFVSASGTIPITTTEDSGTATPSGGNLNLLGQQAGTIPVMSTSGSGATARFEDRTWTTPFVVDASSTVGLRGTFTTIAAALTAAVSGQTIYIRPGSYTENLTLKAGVNLVAYIGSADTPTVTIIGNATATFAGTCTISGIRLQTNSAALLTSSGSSATIINLINCYINCTNNTGISASSSSASSIINLIECNGNLGTTGIGYFTDSSAGQLRLFNTNFQNTGASTTASTKSAGLFTLQQSTLASPLTYSSSNTGSSILFADLNCSAINTAPITTSGTGIITIQHSNINGGTASGISIGTGTQVAARQNVIRSSNTNAITGAGTLEHSSNVFFTSSTINATTQNGEYCQLAKWQAFQQPAFLATQTTVQDNLSINSTSTFNINNEIFDQSGDYNNSTFTFTAPVTGRYLLNFMVRLNNTDTATINYDFNLVTSNRTYTNTTQTQVEITADGLQCRNITVLADMDAADTASCKVAIPNSGASQADVQTDSGAATFTNFSGILLA